MTDCHISIPRSSLTACVAFLRALGQAATDAIPPVLVGALASAVSVAYLQQSVMNEPLP